MEHARGRYRPSNRKTRERGSYEGREKMGDNIGGTGNTSNYFQATRSPFPTPSLQKVSILKHPRKHLTASLDEYPTHQDIDGLQYTTERFPQGQVKRTILSRQTNSSQAHSEQTHYQSLPTLGSNEMTQKPSDVYDSVVGSFDAFDIGGAPKIYEPSHPLSPSSAKAFSVQTSPPTLGGSNIEMRHSPGGLFGLRTNSVSDETHLPIPEIDFLSLGQPTQGQFPPSPASSRSGRPSGSAFMMSAGSPKAGLRREYAYEGELIDSHYRFAESEFTTNASASTHFRVIGFVSSTNDVAERKHALNAFRKAVLGHNEESEVSEPLPFAFKPAKGVHAYVISTARAKFIVLNVAPVMNVHHFSRFLSFFENDDSMTPMEGIGAVELPLGLNTVAQFYSFRALQLASFLLAVCHSVILLPSEDLESNLQLFRLFRLATFCRPCNISEELRRSLSHFRNYLSSVLGKRDSSQEVSEVVRIRRLLTGLHGRESEIVGLHSANLLLRTNNPDLAKLFYSFFEGVFEPMVLPTVDTTKKTANRKGSRVFESQKQSSGHPYFFSSPRIGVFNDFTDSEVYEASLPAFFNERLLRRYLAALNDANAELVQRFRLEDGSDSDSTEGFRAGSKGGMKTKASNKLANGILQHSLHMDHFRLSENKWVDFCKRYWDGFESSSVAENVKHLIGSGAVNFT